MYQSQSHVVVRTARIQALATDLLGVQRVLTLLTGRNYSLTRFEAEEAGGGRWRLRVETIATDHDQVELLQARLQRLPSLLVVDAEWSGSAPVTGQRRLSGSPTAHGQPEFRFFGAAADMAETG